MKPRPAARKHMRCVASSSSALPHRPRRQPPLRLRRCDLPTEREGRASISLSARLVDVGLPSLLDRMVAEAGAVAVVDVSLTVSAAAGGAFFVRGRAATGPLRLACDTCGRPCDVNGLTSDLQFVTTPAAGAAADGGAADELPWPRTATWLDLTPTVAAALADAMPSTVTCGSTACSAEAAAGWAAAGETAGKSGLGGGAAGARLAALKARLQK